MGKIMRALGLMSGTSLDGIDVAYIETDGENAVKRGPSMTFPYRSEVRSLLMQAIDDARGLLRRDERPGTLAQAERELTELHAAAVSGFLRRQAMVRDEIDVIGFHGQTVLHAPASALTVQLGLGDMLAQLTGIPVVYDMRAADVAAGGQGAPLVPVYHRALTAHLAERPLAIVNIGGVANVTYIDDDRLIAFDTGPGNSLIDDWMQRNAGQARDDGGEAASSGCAVEGVLQDLLSHAYFKAAPPKSLDRNSFETRALDGMSVADGAATLAAFTAHAIARGREHLANEPLLWVVAGGGRHNRAIMQGLAGIVQHAVVPAEAIGLDGDGLEAEAWAYLAVRALRRLPITFPGTTGVSSPLTGGLLARPEVSPARANDNEA